MEQPVKFENTALPDILELRGVKQVYEERVIIEDFNLLIEDKPDVGEFVVLLGASGCGKCVAKGSWIVTANGLRRIEDLFPEDQPPDTVSEVEDLEVIVGGNRERISHRYYGGLKKTIKINMSDGSSLEGTPEHPVLVDRNGKTEWVKLSKIRCGDAVVKEGYQDVFDNQRHTVEIISIENSENEVYDLTNPSSNSFVVNGLVVHNSTVLRYLAGLQHPTEGQILIHGKERSSEDRLAMVFQQYSSFPWLTVLDNVALGLQYRGISKKLRREQAMEMIVKVGLEGHEDKFAQYPTLSGGQLQRVAIARSLLYKSEIILMDEPFGALDIETRLQMQELLAKIWVEIHPTVVFVTHDIPEAVYLGDSIYVMGRNPGNIRRSFTSPLPFARDKTMKRSVDFLRSVNEIEDYMMEVNRS